MDEVRERSMTRPDDRVVAWTEYGDPTGTPLLRVPGTPGCRWSLRADRSPYDERGLFLLNTERPGFGASTPLPGRGYVEHADDLAALLDTCDLERLHVHGGSGAAHHILAFCERHPDRVRAATILVGISPVEASEVQSMIDLNRQGFELARAGDRAGLERLLGPVREAVLADPLAAFESIMATAPPEDLEILADPEFRASFAKANVEALAGGLDGWVDETMAMASDWPDVHPERIGTSITWYHARGDRNCPFTAAQRLVRRLPNATLVEWPAEVGHLHGFHEEGELLDELLGRG
jgi:pimeloyl-ACP methyl ester carboxylesterase